MTRRQVIQSLATATAMSATPSFGNTFKSSSEKSFGDTSKTGSAKIRRGVSLYSYQEEYYIRSMTLEDCLAEASAIGAYGIELLPEQMIPGFPNPNEKWVENWVAMNAKHHTIPITYTQFQDTYLTPDHDLTTDQGVAMLQRDLNLAKRLAFRNVRLLIGTPLDVIERCIPMAEQLDVRMNIEIHAPCPIDGPLVHKWVEIIEKHKTTHFGLNPDMGLFVEREARIDRDRRIRDGQVREKIARFIDKSYAEKMQEDRVGIELKNLAALPGEVSYLHAVYSPGGQSPKLLASLVPYSHHIHAKFYEMTEQYEEYSIPYDQIVKVLIDGGYEGYLASEWEGQRITQDAFETDSCEQVRRQHWMLKQLLGEV